MDFYKIKFSELSIDMFRILQAVEREPSGERLTVTFENSNGNDRNQKSPGANLYV